MVSSTMRLPRANALAMTRTACQAHTLNRHAEEQERRGYLSLLVLATGSLVCHPE